MDSEQTSSERADTMLQAHAAAPAVGPGEAPAPAARGIETLGVLFVHGIGAQRRGDTLVQCGAAIHGWLRQWIAQPAFEQGSLSVELLDTSLTQPRADEPAHSRLVFRKESVLSPTSWILAESCWAEAFRPPTYSEFVRWALRVLPLAIILHLVSAFRRDLRVMRTATQVVDKGFATLEEFTQLETDLRPQYGPLPTDPLALRRVLRDQAFHAGNRWLIAPFALALLLFVALFVQAILLAVVVIGLLPIGFLRSLTGRVQKTVAAVLGDSYLFVASPICASAAVTQVKRDFQWLGERCDQVAILAHSQGAAVVYRALNEWSWEGRIPEKLKLLISYGSGLQKLFALQELARDQGPEETLKIRTAGGFAFVGSIGIMTFWLWVVGAIPLWLVALGLVVGFVCLMLALFWFDQAFSHAAPSLPAGVNWVNLFASHDPVPNGPTAVRPPQFASTGFPALDGVHSLISKQLVDFFHLAQREVVNLRSTIADHTRYWSARDDFVADVVMRLLHISDIPTPGTVDAEWTDISAQRRRWRVGLRAGCRTVAILAALCVIVFEPAEVIRALGARVGDGFSRATVSLPAPFIPDWTRNLAVPGWAYGHAALLICAFGAFVIAMAGWRMWEEREFAHFFRREPFRTAGVGLAIFALGWLGILSVIPAATAFAGNEQTLGPALWSSLLLLAVSGWVVVRSGKGPGRFSTWIPALLDQGERLLEQETGDRSENVARARGYFSWAGKWLFDQKDSMERVRAILGMARVLEESEPLDEAVAKQPRAFYEEALASLERMGKDTGAVRERLNKLSSDTASAEPTQRHGEPSP